MYDSADITTLRKMGLNITCLSMVLLFQIDPCHKTEGKLAVTFLKFIIFEIYPQLSSKVKVFIWAVLKFASLNALVYIAQTHSYYTR